MGTVDRGSRTVSGLVESPYNDESADSLERVQMLFNFAMVVKALRRIIGREGCDEYPTAFKAVASARPRLRGWTAAFFFGPGVTPC